MVTSLEVESGLLVGSEVCVGSCCRATAKGDEHTFSIKWDPVSPKSSVTWWQSTSARPQIHESLFWLNWMFFFFFSCHITYAQVRRASWWGWTAWLLIGSIFFIATNSDGCSLTFRQGILFLSSPTGKRTYSITHIWFRARRDKNTLVWSWWER